MNKAVFLNDTDRQESLKLALEASEGIRDMVKECGVSHVLKRMAEEIGHHVNVQRFFLHILKTVVIDLYALEWRPLKVIAGRDPKGLYVSAQCFSGAYAEWHEDPSMNIFENWNREARP